MLTIRKKKLDDTGSTDAEARRRNLNLSAGRLRTAMANSIGEIPKCKNPARREAAEKTLQAWVETYLLSLFANPKTKEHYPWSTTQIEAFALAEKVVRFGGNFGVAMRRGGFKTGLCKAAVLFGSFLGLQLWTCIVAATSPKAKKILRSLKTVLEVSKELREDYPEICVAIRALENQSNRTKRQTYTYRKEELPTRMEWGTDRVVFPDIIGAPGRQAVLTAIGLTGSDIRGQLMTTGELADRRPTCVLFDDVETDESASSDLQTPQRMELFESAMYMGGVGVPLAAFYAGTIIKGDSVCARVLDSPGWHSVLKPAMPKMPLHCAETPAEIEHLDLWGQYGELLRLKDPDEARRASTEMYEKYRAKPECLPILDQPRPCGECEMRHRCMDANAVVDWIHAKDPHHLSAVQFCMDVYLLKQDKFFAEFQQAPRVARNIGVKVSPEQIMSRTSGHPRGEIPGDAVIVTVGKDVHKEILYYVICAWAADFTGVVVDYGTFPDQGVRVFHQANPPKPLRLLFAETTLDADGILQGGLVTSMTALKAREFQSQSGVSRTFQIGKMLADGRYGTRLVHAAIKKLGWGTTAEVSMGVGDQPGQLPISMWDTKKTDKDGRLWQIGDNWYRRPVQGTQEAPHVSIGVDHWKTFVHKGFALLPGTRGSLQIFGSEREASKHQMFADHVAGAEYPKELPPDRFGRVITQWKAMPGGPDNHYFDALVLATVAASVSGMCKPPVRMSETVEKPKRRAFALASVGGGESSAPW